MTTALVHCTRCKTDRPNEEFYKHPDGTVRRPCKPCQSEYRKQRYRADDYMAEGVQDRHLRRTYGITLDEYNAKLRAQAHRCAICRRAETATMKSTGKLRRLAVDHDHVTGAIRGLLCHRCNLLVWAIEDNHTTLDAIRRYVEEFRDTFANGAPIEG